MTRDEANIIVRPLIERCSRTNWRSKWSIRRGTTHWHAEIKVHGADGDAKVWVETSAHTEAATLQSAVRVTMWRIEKADALDERDRAYWGRLEAHDPGISTESVEGMLVRVRALSARGIFGVEKL